MIIPRPYQIEAVNSIFDYFIQGNTGNPCISMPTGTGKSIVPALFMQQALCTWPSQRMLLATHVKELVEQDYNAMMKVWPTAPAGIFSAGLDRKEAYAPLLFGGIASMKNAIHEIGYRDIMFVDEAHLISPNDTSMYQQFIEGLRYYNPCIRIIGLTATPFRMGQGRITDPGGIFTDLVFDITGVTSFNRLIDECYLSPLVPRPTNVVIDVSDVRELALDFNQGQLQASIKRQNITQRALEESYYIGRDRKSWMVFGAGIENCERIAEILNRMGVATTYVHSKMPDEDRDNRLNAFKQGYFRAIVSNNILTTGFDHPEVDMIIDLRPTTSVVLHVQKYGRGTRPYYHPRFSFDSLQHLENRQQAIWEGGKKNCIVLDFAGNTMRLGPINDPRIPKKKGKGNGDVPIKICPLCGAYNHTSVRFCIDCQGEFIFRTKIKGEASTADIIKKDEDVISTLPISNMTFAVHQKAGKSPKLKVCYFVAYQMFTVWLGFEDKGFPKHKSHEWWRQHCNEGCPSTVAEAMQRVQGEHRRPSHIVVDGSGEFPQILEYQFQ